MSWKKCKKCGGEVKCIIKGIKDLHKCEKCGGTEEIMCFIDNDSFFKDLKS